MIRSVKLICAECGENFVPQDGVLYYKDNYINNTVKEAKFIGERGQIHLPGVHKKMAR